MDTTPPLDQALRVTGEVLARRGQGTFPPDGPPTQVQPPDPLPKALTDAIATVARDPGLPPDWLNTTVAGLWQTGLPPGFASRVIWNRHAGLWVGVAGRLDLIYLKLYAAADDTGPVSRHFADLRALRPTEDELAAARAWISQTQDPSPAMATALERVTAHVLANR